MTTQPTSPPALALAGVHRRFRDGPDEIVALHDVTCTVHHSEMVALTGPSGSGKSTLLHLAAGMDRPDGGTVTVEGTDLATLDATGLAALRRHHVGVVFQRLNLVTTLTAEENVALPLELDGVSAGEATTAARQALRRVGLTPPFDRYPDALSGGQQQRVAIARSLVGQRRLLLADEPTGALDTASSEAVFGLLADLAADDGCAVVVVTHEPRLAAHAERILRLRDGVLTEQGGGAARAVSSAETDAPHGTEVRS
ncbi:MAG: ABC transporter ATP-binding protein [Acidimicrobiia bacterium]|nr:ABC transporter ATP-binding protein [Acidimicrobiia bacterium]